MNIRTFCAHLSSRFQGAGSYFILRPLVQVGIQRLKEDTGEGYLKVAAHFIMCAFVNL